MAGEVEEDAAGARLDEEGGEDRADLAGAGSGLEGVEVAHWRSGAGPAASPRHVQLSLDRPG